jgi:hypothetical protein
MSSAKEILSLINTMFGHPAELSRVRFAAQKTRALDSSAG